MAATDDIAKKIIDAYRTRVLLEPVRTEIKGVAEA